MRVFLLFAGRGGKKTEWLAATVSHVDRGFHRETTYDVRLEEERSTTDRFGRTRTSRRFDDVKKVSTRAGTDARRKGGKEGRREGAVMCALVFVVVCERAWPRYWDGMIGCHRQNPYGFFER